MSTTPLSNHSHQSLARILRQAELYQAQVVQEAQAELAARGFDEAGIRRLIQQSRHRATLKWALSGLGIFPVVWLEAYLDFLSVGVFFLVWLVIMAVIPIRLGIALAVYKAGLNRQAWGAIWLYAGIWIGFLALLAPDSV